MALQTTGVPVRESRREWPLPRNARELSGRLPVLGELLITRRITGPWSSGVL